MQFTETGNTVYQRTYSRTKPDGTKETWPETVRRVVDGNLALGDSRHEMPGERDALIRMMEEFKVVPAGRHLWASGVKGVQYLFNCHVSGWNQTVTDHFSFTFLRLMEGGGVGANYSNRYLDQYPEIAGHQYQDFDNGPVKDQPYNVHIVCDPEHPDYQLMKDAGLLSEEYVSEWQGCYEVGDSREGWAAALTDLLETYYRPAANVNRVFDVSRVRARGSRLKTFQGTASGPAPLAQMLHDVAEVMNDRIGLKLDGIGAMEIDHAIATCVVSGGVRRSARMSIMRWDDEQILEFLSAKQDTGKHWTTNISVEVDASFFTALGDYERMKDGANTGQYWHRAHDVMMAIVRGMLANGEPGIWNSELSNVGEPNQVIATNPCGEIALREWENCNLGHVNLAAFVDEEPEEFELAHRLVTRFLIRATNGDVTDPKQAAVLAANRRIGVGHLGVASFIAMSGQRYSEAARSHTFEDVLVKLAAVVDAEAISYSHDLRIPVPVKTRTVAPTGTIAKMPGVSEGIHPIFAKYFLRRIRFSDVDAAQRETVEDYRSRGYHVEPCQYAPNTTVVTIPTKDILVEEVERRFGEEKAEQIVESAEDLSMEDMLEMQKLYQRAWADNAVSYTVNLDPKDYTPEGVAATLLKFGPDLKGTTINPEKSRAQSPYERITKADYELYGYLAQTESSLDESCATGACPVK